MLFRGFRNWWFELRLGASQVTIAIPTDRVRRFKVGSGDMLPMVSVRSWSKGNVRPTPWFKRKRPLLADCALSASPP